MIITATRRATPVAAGIGVTKHFCNSTVDESVPNRIITNDSAAAHDKRLGYEPSLVVRSRNYLPVKPLVPLIREIQPAGEFPRKASSLEKQKLIIHFPSVGD